KHATPRLTVADHSPLPTPLRFAPCPFGPRGASSRPPPPCWCCSCSAGEPWCSPLRSKARATRPPPRQPSSCSEPPNTTAAPHLAVSALGGVDAARTPAHLLRQGRQP